MSRLGFGVGFGSSSTEVRSASAVDIALWDLAGQRQGVPIYQALGGGSRPSVPVYNTWISGAWRWTKATRVRYYNDLRDPRTLVAVDAHDNEVKGGDDPTAWMPSHGKCRYIRYWTAVKTRWHLNVSEAEKSKLASRAANCRNAKLRITKAVVKLR